MEPKKGASLRPAQYVRKGSMGEKMLRNLKNLVMSFIPSQQVRSLHPKFFYPVAILLGVALAGIFLALFLPGFYDQINTKYLSPLSSSTDKECTEVPISNTGSFVATMQGYWKGSTNYNFTDSAFVLNLNDVTFTDSTYQTVMESIYSGLQLVGDLASTRDLSLNILAWNSFVLVGFGSAQRFYMTGSPLSVFNRQKTKARMSNRLGICGVEPAASFSIASGLLSAQFDYSDFKADPLCSQIIDPEMMGYSELLDGNTFGLSVDVRAILTAMAVNIQIISLDSLEMVIGTTSYLEYDGVNLTTNKYYDPRYPAMSSLTCLNETSVLPVTCIIEVGYTYALPFFLHRGSDPTYPRTCNCTALRAQPDLLSNPHHDCNLFQFLSGFLFYNSDSAQPLLRLVLTYFSEGVRRRSFQAMFASSIWGLSSPYRATLNSTTFLSNALDFCRIDGQDCVLLTFSSLDYPGHDWTVSDSFYQLQRGACADTFSPTQEAWQRLIDQPFAPLKQEYAVCKDTLSAAFINQVGVAMGNMGIVTPFSVFFILFALSLYQCCSGQYVPVGYDPEEKQEMLERVAVLMLLARDHHLEYPAPASSVATSVGSSSSSPSPGAGTVHSSGPTSTSTTSVTTSHGTSLHLIERLLDEVVALFPQLSRQYEVRGSRRTTKSRLLINWQKLLSSAVQNKRIVSLYGGQYDMLPFNFDARLQARSPLWVLNTLPSDLESGENAPPLHYLNAMSADGPSEATLREVVGRLINAVHHLVLEMQSCYHSQGHAALDRSTASLETTQPVHGFDPSRIRETWSLLIRTTTLQSVNISLQEDDWGMYPKVYHDCVYVLVEKIVHLLLLHAALLFQCDVQEVRSKHKHSVGYKIGRDVYSLQELLDMAWDSSNAYVAISVA